MKFQRKKTFDFNEKMSRNDLANETQSSFQKSKNQMIDSIANVNEFDKLKNIINERQSQFTIASLEKRKQNVEKKVISN